MNRAAHPDDCRDLLRAVASERAAQNQRTINKTADAIDQSLAAGLSVVEIATLLDVSRTTVYQTLKRRQADD